MAEIQLVKRVDDRIKLQTVIVSCTNKEGLVSNERVDGSIIEALPEDGLLGCIAKCNPNVLFISTGATFKVVREAGLRVMEISEYTGFPEMKTGLVKSLHPRIHAGILAHRYTTEDAEFMKEHGIRYVDAVIANFYPLDETRQSQSASFEAIRQAIDVGGPTMSHAARKAFVSTAVITDPQEYPTMVAELKRNGGTVSLRTRLKLAKSASALITRYMLSVNEAIQSLEFEDLERSYEIQYADP